MRALLIVACATFAARAYGGPSQCPTDEAVRAELAGLLPQLPPEAGKPSIAVADLGDHFQLTLNGADRVFADGRRDCAARARMAGVALAVALSPPTFTFSTPARPIAPPVAVVPPIPERARRRRLFFGIDVGTTYGYFGEAHFGGGTIQLHVGADFPRWTVEGVAFFQASATLLDNNGYVATAYPYLAGGVGPAFALKRGARWRIGVSSTIGFAGGDAGAPENNELFAPPNSRPGAYGVSGGIVTLTPSVSVDLSRHGRQVIYAELAPYYRVWFGFRAPSAFETNFGPGFWPNRNEVGVRLSFGFRSTR